MIFKAATTVGRGLSAIVFAGWLASAGGCAAPVGSTESEKTPQASEPAAGAEATHPVTEEAQKAVPDVACKAPLITCVCEFEGEYESWCTTETVCLRVCGDRI
jgi:hypothetical protein